MNKAVGLGIGVVAVIIAIVVGGSTMLGENGLDSLKGIPNDGSNNNMMMGDKVSVTVKPAEENIEEETETTEGKSLEVNLVDGVSATSTP